jgi:hypothetical protein
VRSGSRGTRTTRPARSWRGSRLRIEISAVEDGTLLVLDHRKLTTEPALRVGPGWHAHLDTLGTVLAGNGESVESWRERFEALRPRYAELVADDQSTI